MESGGTRLLWPPGKTVDPDLMEIPSRKIGSQKRSMHRILALEHIERYIVKPHGQLVRVSLMHYCTSTPRLSTL